MTFVRRANRNDSGVLGVTFDQLQLAGGGTLDIDGKLTSTDPAERRQIDAQGDAQVVLVGGRQGVGATIGAIGGSDEADPLSGFLGAIGSMLSEGSDVDLPAGTRAAVQLGRSIVLNAVGDPTRRPDAFTIYTAAETIQGRTDRPAKPGLLSGSDRRNAERHGARSSPSRSTAACSRPAISTDGPPTSWGWRFPSPPR